MLAIDHVTVAGVDLLRMHSALRAVGLDTVYGGPHRDGLTEMALVSFPDGSYLELIAPLPHVPREIVDLHPWSGFLLSNAGPCAWAVCTPDIDAEVSRLRSTGIAVSTPVANGRRRPDGVEVKWRTAACGCEPMGSFFPFLIEDITPRSLRAFPQGGPINRDYGGIAHVVLAVRNLDEAMDRFAQAYGLSCTVRQVDRAFGAHFAMPDSAPIILAEPLDSDSWLAARLERLGEAPCAVLLKPSDTESHSAPLEMNWFDDRVLGWRLGTFGWPK